MKLRNAARPSVWALAVVLSTATFACSDSKSGAAGGDIDAVGGPTNTISTTLDPATIAAGGTSSVACRVLDPNGDPLEATTTFTVEPMDGITIDGTTITATRSGEFRVACAAAELSLTDAAGATLTVTAGEAAQVEAVLAKDEVKPAESTTVECVVTDEHGNRLEGMPTTVSADSDFVQITDHTVVSNASGTFDITCTVDGQPDLPTTPDTLTVGSGEPVAVELKAEPDKAAHARNIPFQLVWVVTDEWGNEVPDVPATLTIPEAGVEVVNAEENRYRFTEQGIYDFSVTLDAPYEGITDDAQLVCDDEGPTIVITFPERGAMLQGTGEEPVTVTGTISDNYGEVAGFTVNGNEASIGEDGSFSVDVTEVWGMNLLQMLASDSYGNVSKLTPTFHYAEGYTSFVDTDAEGVKAADGVQAMLGQSFLDDGIHDPTDIDDLATLLEVLLSNIDLAAVLQGSDPNNPAPLLEQVVPLVAFDVPGGLGKLSGDLVITVTIVPPTDIGPTSVSLDSTLGGINTTIDIGDASEAGLVLNLAISVALVGEIEVFGQSFGATGSLDIDSAASADVLHFSGKIILDKDTNGPLNTGVENMDLSWDNLSLNPITDAEMVITTQGIPSWLGGNFSFTLDLSFLASLGDIFDAVFDVIANDLTPFLVDLFGAQVEQFVGDALLGVLEQLEISQTLTVPDFLAGEGDPEMPIDVEIYTAISSAHFDEPGGQMGLYFGTYADKGIDREPLGSIKRMGCLTGNYKELVYDWAHELGIAVATDALNALFFGVWWSGYLNRPLDVSALAGDSLPLPLDNFVIELDPYLPPIVNDCSKLAGVELQIGDMKAYLDGNILGEYVAGDAFLDLTIVLNFEATEEGLMVTFAALKELDIEVVAVGEGADPDTVKTLLEDSLGPILESFLVGESFGPIEIPEFDISGLVDGLPPGITLGLGELEITKDSGYVLIETDLD